MFHFGGGRSKLGYSNSGFNSPGRKVLLGFVNINFLGVYRDEGVLWFVVWGHLNWFKIDLSLSLLKPVFFIFNRRERNRFKANKTSPSLSLKLQTQYHLAFYGFLSTNSSLLTRGLLFLKYQDSEFYISMASTEFHDRINKTCSLAMFQKLPNQPTREGRGKDPRLLLRTSLSRKGWPDQTSL